MSLCPDRASKITWTIAREEAGINKCAALCLGLIKLIFWHIMQPLLYIFVLYAFWDLLDKGQQFYTLAINRVDSLEKLKLKENVTLCI